MLKYSRTTYRIIAIIFLFSFLSEGIFGELFHTHNIVSKKVTSFKLDDCTDGHHHTSEQQKDCLSCVRVTYFFDGSVPLVSHYGQCCIATTSLTSSFSPFNDFYISSSKRGPPQIFSLV